MSESPFSPLDDPGPDAGRWSRVERILDRALELGPGERAAYLEEVWASDPELKAEVEALLARQPALEGFLAEPLPLDLGTFRGPEPDPQAFEGERIGSYRVVRTIARGGMGWVFLAERADGLFQRRVALKLLRPALDDPDAIRRFEIERRILARLEHPGIARLIDAGITPEGRPYLVTEYVEGRPIHQYCQEGDLPLEGRLELVCQVAEAVHYAHQNLLVHRDLKPSNILVTSRGQAKLLDFGIAKILGGTEGDLPSRQDQTEGGDAGLTRPGLGWLTPGYAAPEQLSGGPVTTATDVYQLGVLLYRLLTDCRPFESQEHSLFRLEKAMLREDPVRPSRAARENAGAHPVTGRELEGDLDAIILMALRHEPADRYASVRSLLDDLERRRKGQPVVAREGTARYRLSRFIRRHRVETAAAVAVAAALLGGSAVAAWQAGEAHRERDQAREARVEAERALAQSRDVTRVLMQMLQAIDPWEGTAGDPRVARELLSLGTAHVVGLEGQPMVQAGLLEVLARLQLTLGRLDEAEALALQALELRMGAVEEAGPEVAESLNVLALVRTGQGRYREADDLHEEALAVQRRYLGDAHPDVARTLSFLAGRRGTEDLEAALALHREAWEIRSATLGPAHPLTVTSLRAVGRLHRARGERTEAEAAFTEALALLRDAVGADHPEVAQAKLNLADLLRDYDLDPERVEELNREALRIQREAFGPDHPGLTHPMENLARIHSKRGEYASAEALLREGLDLRRRVFGPEHRAVAEGLDQLATEMARQGRLDEAEALRGESIVLWEEAVGADHWAYGGALATLADLLVRQGRFDEAESLYDRAIAIRAAARGPGNSAVGLAYGSMARMEALRGDWARADELYRQALDILLEQRTEDHHDVRRLRAEMAELHAAR